MNRIKEYQDLLMELDRPVPELLHTLNRAYQRRKRRNRIVRPIAVFAASFTIFILLVNFCSPVAYACSKVPLLKELAEAVTFSPSLSDAVEHEYVQPINLSQTENDVTASVEYLIVDQKQINVFFRLDSKMYSILTADPVVLSADGSRPESCAYGYDEWDIPNGELQKITIDYVNENVPDSLILKLKIRDMSYASEDGTATEAAPENVQDFMFEEHHADELEYIVQFEFLLEFDPEFTVQGKVMNIDQTIILDEQVITITDIEVYPTHLRVNVEGAEGNTAWLRDLEFYIKAGWGRKFDTISNGISATGSSDTPAMVSFRADSSWFYEAKHLTLVITGATWLDKDMEKVYVNLKTGETGRLPDGVKLHSATLEKGGWLVSFEAERMKPELTHQVFMSTYYDAAEKSYHISRWSSGTGSAHSDNIFGVTFPLKGYYQDEVWLTLCYSHVWTAEKPISIRIH